MPRWQRTPSATRVHRSSAASTGAYSERSRFVTSTSSGRNGVMSSLTLVRFSPSNRPLHHRSCSRARKAVQPSIPARQCRLTRSPESMAGMACALGLHAKTYPSRPIRLVVPFPPGGSSDSVARVVVLKFSEGLGQPVVIENRPGVGGLLGSEAVAKAAPDGYTLLLGSVSSLAVAPHMFANPKIDPGKDFAAIAPIMSSPLTVIARPALPVNSIADLIALARSKPGALNYGAAGVGTHVYLVGERDQIRDRID